jgi:HD-GYP domain-containing protein (c-di-GMP phosphodiesterase class II)/pSer/pThr/pTyr-binding forkhead associated (FHA) protein
MPCPYLFADGAMPVLRIKNGPDKGKAIEIGDTTITIGRDATETVQILDQGASRRHAEVFRIGEMVFIRDLASKNGTFVNDERIQEELLQIGDKIKIGTTLFVFEEGVAGAEEEEEPKIHFAGGDLPLETTMEIDLRAAMDTAMQSKAAASGLANLKVLYTLAEALGSATDGKILTEKVLQLCVDAVDADAGYVFVKEPSGKLSPQALFERHEEEGRKISRSIIKRVFKYGKAVLTSDAASDTRFRENQSVVIKKIQSVICVPLTAFDRVGGVLYLHRSRVQEAFTQEEFELATAIGFQAGVAVMNLQAAERHQRMLAGAVRSLVATFEMHHPDRAGHSGRVCIWATAISNELKLGATENRDVQLAAILHDVGMIALPAESFLKDDPEGSEDHVRRGAEIVQNIEGMEGILPGILRHHERANGSGYPDGLKGDAIPLIARIIGVADRFDHLSRENRLGLKKALVAVGKNEEGLFDQKVVEALLLAYRNGTLFAPPRLLLEQFEARVEEAGPEPA